MFPNWPLRPNQNAETPKYFQTQEVGTRLSMGEVEILKQLAEEHAKHGIVLSVIVAQRDAMSRPLSWTVEMHVKAETGLVYAGYINYEFRKRSKHLKEMRESVQDQILNQQVDHPAEATFAHGDPLLNWHPVKESCTDPKQVELPEVKIALPQGGIPKTAYYGMPWHMQARLFHGWRDLDQP